MFSLIVRYYLPLQQGLRRPSILWCRECIQGQILSSITTRIKTSLVLTSWSASACQILSSITTRIKTSLDLRNTRWTDVVRYYLPLQQGLRLQPCCRV